MELIRAKITVTMNFEDAVTLNRLIVKDTAMPIVQNGVDEWDETQKRYACPTCGNRVYDDLFCKYCGQRLDTTNIEL